METPNSSRIRAQHVIEVGFVSLVFFSPLDIASFSCLRCSLQQMRQTIFDAMYRPQPYPGLEVAAAEYQYGPNTYVASNPHVASKENIAPPVTSVISEPPRTQKRARIIAAVAVVILLVIAGVVGGVVGGLKSKHNNKPITDT
jgi:hypothetical protein